MYTNVWKENNNVNEKIAAMVILYHYTEQNIQAIESYVGQVEKVYCFDNSEIEQIDLKCKLLRNTNVEYLTCHQNIGLSVAINKVAQRAISEGFQWLITFDQDSRASKNMIVVMRDFLAKHKQIDKIGIIAPVIDDGKTKFGIQVSEYSYYDRVIQSGAMHNLEILKKVKGYDEKLFIDQVDFEYCIRLLQEGYKIIKLNRAILIHNFEDKEAKVQYIKGKRYTLNKYSPIRYYYIVRNNLFCGKKYKRVFRPYYAETKRNIEILCKTLRYEEEKRNKRKAIVVAYIDYYLGRMGKCKWKL